MKRLFRSAESDYHQVSALFEHATEGIVLTNGEGNIVLINPSALKLFHYELDEVLGMPIETLIPTRFHSDHLKYRKSFYEHPSNRAMGHGRELFARTKEGSEFPVEVSLSFYSHDKEFYVIAFIVDITSRKQSEKALLNQKKKLEAITEDMRKLNFELETKVEQRTLILREALQELEKSQKELNEALNKEKELNEIKSRFVSMASHEFRTPLSTILSSATLISKYAKSEDQDKRDKHIKRIRDSVKHLNELLEDFLSLGKLEEGRINAQGGDFCISEFADETIDELKTILKNGQQIHHSSSGDDYFVSDKRLLRNILINLISNSAKFSPEGAGIWLSMKNYGEELEIIVRDEGVGISESDQQHLFSSFFRGANANNVEGTGLGLHIVKRYVQLLQGNIELHSQLNKGTTITMKIPPLPAAD